MESALVPPIAEALSRAFESPVEVLELAPLIGGACQENFRLSIDVSRGPSAGKKRLVLRSDAKSTLPGSLDRSAELRVIRAAREVGVRTPNAFQLTPNLIRAGAFAYFLDWVDGEAIGAKVLRDPRLEGARAALPEALAKELAAIHRVTPRTHPELTISDRDAAEKADPARAAIAFNRSFIDQLPEPRPVLELVLAWLDAHRPPPSEVTLVHGDFRTGNFMVRPEGLEAVLDWEFARWGSPFEDIAWLCLRDWRFGQLKNAAGGISTRARFYAAYEVESKRKVDPDLVLYWEVMANVRWALGAFVQGLRYLQGKESDLELLAIGRRTQEMEFEALRLIESRG